MPLLNTRLLSDALRRPTRGPTIEEFIAAKDWSERASSEALDTQNESQLEQEFNKVVLQGVLGYTPPISDRAGTMRVKQPVPGGGIVDVALGQFDDSNSKILAPLELKGPKVPLDRIMPGRNKTPVQQAWDYAMDAPGARWVLLTNMKELRLYAVGYGRQNYEAFDLKRLDDRNELTKLQLLLHAEQLLTGRTAEFLKQSAEADRQITDQLYKDYREIRVELSQFVRNQCPRVSAEQRIKAVQTLLDRVLFIAFAEDRRLLPANSLSEAVNATNKFNPTAKWTQLKTLFSWVDKGAPPHDIPRYNGGLFKPDDVIDSVDLPDHLVERFGKLGGYDFESDVSVTILGHIFEQSITDIEREKAEAQLATPPATSKKKREGVVYTPDFITRFIVEQTVGAQLAEIADELLPEFADRGDDGTINYRSDGELRYWSAYLGRLNGLKVLDPACGSGAFLIAAFNLLYAEQKRVRDRLNELQPGIITLAGGEADIGIITNNLFGVDVNAESVEITKLALWLQTAKRDRALESLDGNIKHGNSLVDEPQYHEKPFDWAREFPEILSAGNGFDIVIGNPPYVRMEHLKPIKPHLERRFAVAADRADLYAYFFELGARLLKPGGRLGYISSSTFFRTGSGKPLREYLAGTTAIESVVDFGDLQVFEGVTTYPAIVVARAGAPDDGELRYLNVRTMPDDLGKTFESGGMPMPRARLGAGTWRFEEDRLAAIRAKMARGRPTLAEVYGPPLYGIKTGLNDAFVLNDEQHDAIVARARRTPGDRSTELLKPFLVGEDLKRWHVDGGKRWLIYTPKKAIDIDDYPAVRDHLLPFKARLEARATQQQWWELQQAQAAYQTGYEATKVLFPHFNDRANFSFDQTSTYFNDKGYCIPNSSVGLAGLLNSNLSWFQILGMAPAVRGGYRELRVQYVSKLLILEEATTRVLLDQLSDQATQATRGVAQLTHATRHRLGDLDNSIRSASKFLSWPSWSFDQLQGELRKRRKRDVPLQVRDEWESWFNKQRQRHQELTGQLVDAEAEINARVYAAFELTRDEILQVEDALALTSPSLTLKSYEAISAVEGIALDERDREHLRGKARGARAIAA